MRLKAKRDVKAVYELVSRMAYSVLRIGDQVRPVTCATDCKWTRIVYIVLREGLSVSSDQAS